MKIAVTGASGHLGRLIAERIATRLPPGASVVALARTPSKVRGLDMMVLEADYDRPETLSAALTGVNTLVLVSASEIGKRAVQHANVISAAKAAGVQHIVYTSLLHADKSPISLAEEHRATERDLTKSGIPATLLRNGWYHENHTALIAGAMAGGAFFGSAGEGKFSTASRADLAEAAAIVATEPGHQGKTYELAGDTSHTLAQFADEVSRQTGKDLPYNELPVAAFAAALAGFGLPEPIAQAVAGWDVDAASGALFDESHHLSGLLGRATTPIASAIADALLAAPK